MKVVIVARCLRKILNIIYILSLYMKTRDFLYFNTNHYLYNESFNV